jgi:hypothetical protein
MSKTVYPIIETLFASPGQMREPVTFDWRLIRRKGKPFMLLPSRLTNARAGLKIYSAHRLRAKIWRAFLPLLLRTPSTSLFERIQFEADAGSEIMQFLARQSGVPANRLQLSGIKFGGETRGSRLVLLLCDETRRPVSVVKVGLSATGRRATDREADLLEKLPPGMLGCIRMTGRMKTPSLSVFATSYFPGDSPNNDAGMEHLFHTWLNPGPSVPLASLEPWREFAAVMAEADPGAWQILNLALAGKTVHSTLYHGDFAPWNIRAVNSQNLQTYDWERGHLQGIPGWDWFHFFVQTAVLARRHSAERVAAEVEQLLLSERFQKYAAEAGISDIAQPLLLAYLLHQKWIVQPREGGRIASELFELLWIRWQMTPSPQLAGVAAAAPVKLPDSGLWSEAVFQLKTAVARLSNLFWEPSLTARSQPLLRAQFRRHWPVILLAGLLLAGVATAHLYLGGQMIFLPFYLVPCALLTWKIDRRWGAMVATAAAATGPLIQSTSISGIHNAEVTLWNTVMRFITLQFCVLFVGQIRQQKNLPRRLAIQNQPAGKFTENWAVVLASGLLFLVVGILDYVSNPHMTFLPLYLLPCMILTLVLNLRWGIASAVATMLIASLEEYSSNPGYGLVKVFGWNLIMRLAIALLVVLLLDRIRRGNVLFFLREPNHRPASAGGG